MKNEMQICEFKYDVALSNIVVLYNFQQVENKISLPKKITYNLVS